MAAETQNVVVDVSDGVAEVILNRPERKNALTGPLVTELSAALTALAANEDVRVLLLRGAGGSFCSGLDLKEFNADSRPGWLPGFQAAWRGLHEQLFGLDQPVVCALERYAINAGSALALSSDFLVAGETAFLQVGEVIQGRPAPMNLAWLTLRYGDATARRLMMLGRRVPGPELERIGIAFETAPDEEVLTRARELAGELAALPRGGLAAAKSALRKLHFAGGTESWFADAAEAVAEARPSGPIPSLKR